MIPLRWRKWSQRSQRLQWPPSPSVEDEIVSLSREFRGLSFLGELPGIEGVHARGTINQCPLILDVEVLIVSNISHNVGEKSTYGPEISPGQSTPIPQLDLKQDPKQNPICHLTGDNHSQGQVKEAPSRNPPQPQDVLPKGPLPKPVLKQLPQDRKAAGTSQRPLPRRPEPNAREPVVRSDKIPQKPTPNVAQPIQNVQAPFPPVPPKEAPRMAPSSTTLKRSESAKPAYPPKRLSVDPRSIASSGYLSDSATIHRKDGQKPADQSIKPPAENKGPPSPGLSVAQRLEEKLRRRREERESGSTPRNFAPQHGSNSSQSTGPNSSVAAEQRVTQPHGAAPDPTVPPQLFVPPSEPPVVLPSKKLGSPNRSSGDDLLSATLNVGYGAFSKEPPAPMKPAVRSLSLDRANPVPAHQNRRRTVSFAEKPVEQPSQALVMVPQETALAQLHPLRQDTSADSSRSTSPNTSLSLSPCPRSVPVAGYQDWHTIQGLNHLDICPSCIKQMRKSKFRDRFILSTPKPRTEPIRCAMSEPWTRLAWMQTLKKKLDNLDLLFQITRSTPGGKPCTGRIINDQYWYRIIDPDTNTYLPQFNVCSACVRNIRLLMPAHRETFERSNTIQDRVCDFVVDSPRFIRYIDALDLAANRAEQEDARPDLSEFLAYARRKVVLRDCRRSRLILNTWHYMPQLPELTVCEDCYDDIVWPLAKARYPIARQFSTVVRLLPGDGPSSSREASCQLYSPRLRAKFQDAVRRNDMPYLNWVALKRHDAEQRFRDRREELLDDERRGYDCSVELRKNLEEWKRWE